MSNYVYEDAVPFTIRDMGYYIPTIKQGIPTNINTLAEGNGGYDLGDSDPVLVPIGGILIVVDKSIWNAYKNTLSGSDFKVKINIASDDSLYIPYTNLSYITCVFGEEYENIDYVTLLCTFHNSYVSYAPASQNTNISLIYIPTSTTFTKENIPCKTAGGRIIGRHVNWEGSVINFDQYGTRTNLFVPDAKFRDFTQKKILSSSSLNKQLHTPILNYMKPIYIFESDIAYSQPFTDNEVLTDTSLQTRLNLILQGATSSGSFIDDFTAQEGTDAILLNGDPVSPAALLARNVIPTGLIGCNLPNIYELSIVWLESDNIDLIDFTVNAYSKYRLGSPNRFNGNSGFTNDRFCTCTEVNIASTGNVFSLLRFDSDGYIHYDSRVDDYCVLPVLEL